MDKKKKGFNRKKFAIVVFMAAIPLGLYIGYLESEVYKAKMELAKNIRGRVVREDGSNPSYSEETPDKNQQTDTTDNIQPQPFDLRDPLGGLPLVGNRDQQCLQLANRINGLKQALIRLEAKSESAQRDMDDACKDGTNSVNCGSAIGSAQEYARIEEIDGAFYRQKIAELSNLYNQMGCGQ